MYFELCSTLYSTQQRNPYKTVIRGSTSQSASPDKTTPAHQSHPFFLPKRLASSPTTGIGSAISGDPPQCPDTNPNWARFLLHRSLVGRELPTRWLAGCCLNTAGMILVPSAVFGITSYLHELDWLISTEVNFICSYSVRHDIETRWLQTRGLHKYRPSILLKHHMQVRSILWSHFLYEINSHQSYNWVIPPVAICLFTVRSPTQSVHPRSPATVTIDNAEYFAPSSRVYWRIAVFERK